jgi:hypothetical protein
MFTKGIIFFMLRESRISILLSKNHENKKNLKKNMNCLYFIAKRGSFIGDNDDFIGNFESGRNERSGLL